jgi:hypothetical protein
MKDYNFSCQNCDEPFTIMLPEETTSTSYADDCEELAPKRHNLQICKMFPNVKLRAEESFIIV